MKLPLLSSKELCSFLEKEGFVIVRQKGSHRRFEHPDGRMTTVPMHVRDIKRSLLQLILKEIKMDREKVPEKMAVTSKTHELIVSGTGQRRPELFNAPIRFPF